MQLTIKIPDEVVGPLKGKLPPPELGILEAVALNAVLDFLMKIEAEDPDSEG